jgi:NAD(P)-dependent dehydrogenase (short-subunit alcohol dehydrogenase family)
MTERHDETLCLVTGAGSGIGRETAQGLARRGMSLILIDRNQDTLAETVAKVRAAGAPRVTSHQADLSRRAELNALLEVLRSSHARLDVLINNAGVLCEERRETPDGFELTFAVNYAAPVLLTRALLPLLAAAPHGRIVNVSSVAHKHGWLDLDDLQTRRGYFGYRSYARSKLALMLFTRALARRLATTAVTANCLHPGVIATSLGEGGFITRCLRIAGPWLKQPTTGAETSIFLAHAPEVRGTSGQYFIDCRPAQPRRPGRDDARGEALWLRTEALLGLPAWPAGSAPPR